MLTLRTTQPQIRTLLRLNARTPSKLKFGMENASFFISVTTIQRSTKP